MIEHDEEWLTEFRKRTTGYRTGMVDLIVNSMKAYAEHCDTLNASAIDERDAWKYKSTVMAVLVGELLEEYVGEYSADNCPVTNSIDSLYRHLRMKTEAKLATAKLQASLPRFPCMECGSDDSNPACWMCCNLS